MFVIGHRLGFSRKIASVRRQGVAWLAVFAVLAQVLMPFGQALAYDVDGDYEFQTICTATGITQIVIGANGEPIEPLDVPKSCPFCSLHNALILLQPDHGPALASSMALTPVAFAHPVEQRAASVWRSAQQPSRAPPFSI